LAPRIFFPPVCGFSPFSSYYCNDSAKRFAEALSEAIALVLLGKSRCAADLETVAKPGGAS